MDEATVGIYEHRAREWIERRGETTDGLGRSLRELAGTGPVADLGCGAGRYLGEIGPPVVGLDATAAMLELARRSRAPLVRADLLHLPFADGSLAGAFARHSYLHLPKAQLPAALEDLHRVLRGGGVAVLSLIEGAYEGHDLPTDDFAGRFFACYRSDELARSLHDAGFGEVTVEPLVRSGPANDLVATARR